MFDYVFVDVHKLFSWIGDQLNTPPYYVDTKNGPREVSHESGFSSGSGAAVKEKKVIQDKFSREAKGVDTGQAVVEQEGGDDALAGEDADFLKALAASQEEF